MNDMHKAMKKLQESKRIIVEEFRSRCVSDDKIIKLDNLVKNSEELEKAFKEKQDEIVDIIIDNNKKVIEPLIKDGIKLYEMIMATSGGTFVYEDGKIENNLSYEENIRKFCKEHLNKVFTKGLSGCKEKEYEGIDSFLVHTFGDIYFDNGIHKVYFNFGIIFYAGDKRQRYDLSLSINYSSNIERINRYIMQKEKERKEREYRDRISEDGSKCYFLLKDDYLQEVIKDQKYYSHDLTTYSCYNADDSEDAKEFKSYDSAERFLGRRINKYGDEIISGLSNNTKIVSLNQLLSGEIKTKTDISFYLDKLNKIKNKNKNK